MVEQPASEPYTDAPVLDGMDDVDHWSEEAARARLGRLAGELPARIGPQISDGRARFITGASNDGWLLDDQFLRVCWRSDRDRLRREVALIDALPEDVPVARVVASGRTAELSWALSDRIAGTTLADAHELDRGELRALYRQAAGILRSLHDWSPPAQLRSRMAGRPQLEGGDALAVFGADLIPLPVWRVLDLEERLRAIPHADPGLLDAAFDLVGELADVDPFKGGDDDAHVVVHGDPSPGNWIVRDGRVVALLDFEWSRVGPRDLDLVTPIFVAWADRSDLPLLRWLEEDYPELFAGPELERRLWMYELCFFLRGVMSWPPAAPEATLEPGHHLHSLRRILDGPLPR